MPRPFATFGRARPSHRPAEPAMLAVPHWPPDREMAALRVLVKPDERTKGAIRHLPRRPQPWAAADAGRATRTCQEAARRLELDVELRPPIAGEVRWLATFEPGADEERIRAIAAAVSLQLTGRWLTLGKLAIRAGRFYHQERGQKLQLVPATTVHISREIRRELHDMLRPPRAASSKASNLLRVAGLLPRRTVRDKLRELEEEE